MDGAPGAYVLLFAVARRMHNWYVNGARECREDHVMRVEALVLRERATNVFETLVTDDGITTAMTDGRFQPLAAMLEAEKALPRGERRSLARPRTCRARRWRSQRTSSARTSKHLRATVATHQWANDYINVRAVEVRSGAPA